jgi:hypothetical protein
VLVVLAVLPVLAVLVVLAVLAVLVVLAASVRCDDGDVMDGARGARAWTAALNAVQRALK